MRCWYVTVHIYFIYLHIMLCVTNSMIYCVFQKWKKLQLTMSTGIETIKYQNWVQYPFRLCPCGIWSRVLKKWICPFFNHPNHSIIHKRPIKLQYWGCYLKGICTSEALLLNSDKSKGECWRFTRNPAWGCMFDGLPSTSFEIEPQFLMASWWFALHFGTFADGQPGFIVEYMETDLGQVLRCLLRSLGPMVINGGAFQSWLMVIHERVMNGNTIISHLWLMMVMNGDYYEYHWISMNGD